LAALHHTIPKIIFATSVWDLRYHNNIVEVPDE